MYLLSDYDYTLPAHLIAQTPASPPESCKFLVVDKKKGSTQDHIFSDITQLIDPETLIVFNNSKVLKARLSRTPTQDENNQSDIPPVKGVELGKASSGGLESNPYEIFYLHSIDNSPYTFSALVRPGKKFKVGETIVYNDEISFHVDAVTTDGRQLTASQPILEILETYGQMPLPPYIEYEKRLEDSYQPVFANKEGSVAAPTASLHFTAELIDQLASQGVHTMYTTLHVGLGTFKPVHVEDIKTYDIHAETIEIDNDIFARLATAKRQNKKILAVGTTVTRTLESLPYVRKLLSLPPVKGVKLGKASLGGLDNQTISYRETLTQDITFEQANTYISHVLSCGDVAEESRQNTGGLLQFQSKLFLYPGRTFYIIDQLITNFHLPKSSLLMLVAGVVGYDEMKKIYQYAIDQEYRFYSFGDAMRIK